MFMLLVWETNGEMGCPKSPMWESEGEAWSEDESVSSSGSREGTLCNDALHVVGLYGPGQDLSLLEGLVAGLPRPRGPLSQQENRGRAVTKKQRDVVRETERRRNVSDVPF